MSSGSTIRIIWIITLFFHLPICSTIETIWLNTTYAWTTTNGNITCNDFEANECIINCNAPYACGSAESLIKPHIICPANNTRLTINCLQSHACINNVVLSNECAYVEINVENNFNNKMTINAPMNGDLHIHVRSNQSIFNDNIINAHSTNNIIIDCHGNGECQRNIINAESVLETLNISCSNGNNCDKQEIHCPDNNIFHLNPKCHLLCSDNASCHNLAIFAMNGTELRNGIQLNCDNTHESICSDSKVFCTHDRTCDIQYNPLNSEWYCDGTCAGMHQIHTTETLSHTQTIINYDHNDIILANNGKKEHNSTQVTLVAIGYILSGGVIGTCIFCTFIACFVCYLRKYKANKCEQMTVELDRAKERQNDSSISIEYVSKRKSIGDLFIAEIKSTVSTVASAMGIEEDTHSEYTFKSLPKKENKSTDDCEPNIDTFTLSLNKAPSMPSMSKGSMTKYGNMLEVKSEMVMQQNNNANMHNKSSISVSIFSGTPTTDVMGSVHASSFGNDDDAKLSEIRGTNDGYAESETYFTDVRHSMNNTLNTIRISSVITSNHNSSQILVSGADQSSDTSVFTSDNSSETSCDASLSSGVWI